MKSQYSELAAYYDRLNGGTDYDAWASFLIGLFEEHKIGKRSPVLDAGCGTGQITVRLAKAGYDMIGVDISPEMLSIARAFADRQRVSPLLVCQDISRIELYGTVGAAVSTLDSLNYLTSLSDLKSFFASMALYIEKCGLLVFDLNTRYKFENFYGTNTYIIEEDGVFCSWENYYSPSSRIADFRLTVFERLPDGKYSRHDEYQRERYYPDRTVRKILSENGFELLDVFSDTDRSPVGSDDMRRFYVCRRV